MPNEMREIPRNPANKNQANFPLWLCVVSLLQL